MQQQNKNIFTTISLFSLALMFCLPFMVSYHRWPESNYYNQVVAFVLGIASLTIFLKPSACKLSVPISTFVPFLLSIILAIQWFAGIVLYWQETMLGFLYLWWCLFIMLSVVRLKEVYGLEKLVQWLASGLLIGGVFNVLVVFMQLFGADFYFWTFPKIANSYTGNLAQVNLLTDYLSLSLISALYLYVSSKLSLKWLLIIVGLFLIALSLTGSRMSWLYVVMVTVLFFVFGRTSQHQAWKLTAKYIWLLPVCFVLVQFIFPQIVDLVTSSSVVTPPIPAERVVTLAGKESSRLDMIKQSYEIFASYPYLGVGWGQYPWYDLFLADVYTGHVGFIPHSHNIFMQLLAECGVFAGLLLLVGIVNWAITALKKETSPEWLWTVTIVSILLAHSMLEFPLWYAHFLGVFVVVIALGDKNLVINQFKPGIQKAAGGLVMIASLTLITVTTSQYMQIEQWIQQYLMLSQKQRYGMLNEMSEMHQKTLLAEPLHMILTRAYSLLPRKQAPIKAKIAKYETMMHYVQARQDVYRYVMLLAADGQMEKAIKYLERAYVRQPTYAEHFEKQLVKGVKRRSRVHVVLYEKLQRLKERK